MKLATRYSLEGLDAQRPITEALQLRFSFQVGLLGGGLISAAPQGPGDDGGGLDLALRQAPSNSADFLHRPADQWRLLRIIRRLLFGGAGVLAWRRMAASMAKASMTSETCRCQPCQACPGESRGAGCTARGW